MIEYTSQAFDEVLKANPVDVVIDPIGGMDCINGADHNLTDLPYVWVACSGHHSPACAWNTPFNMNDSSTCYEGSAMPACRWPGPVERRSYKVIKPGGHYQLILNEKMSPVRLISG